MCSSDLDADPDPDLPEKVDVSRLAQGFVVSGTENGVAYAAFPCPVRPRSTTGYFFVQFATETTSSGLGKVRRGLLAGAAVAIAVALGVALLLSRRLTRPILAVRRATQQIADGDLTVRIPEDEPGELGELGASINQMAAALQRARGLEQQFLLSVSHDLRTPLTSIRG